MQVPYAVNVVLNSACTEIRHGFKGRLPNSASLSKRREFLCLWHDFTFSLWVLIPTPSVKKQREDARLSDVCEYAICPAALTLKGHPSFSYCLSVSVLSFYLLSKICSPPGFNMMTARMGPPSKCSVTQIISTKRVDEPYFVEHLRRRQDPVKSLGAVIPCHWNGLDTRRACHLLLLWSYTDSG